MIQSPLCILATELTALGRPSLFLEAEEDKVAMILSTLRSDPTRVAELLFLDDVLEALGGERDTSVALQIQIRIDLHTHSQARAALVKLCHRLNRSLGRFGIFPHSGSSLIFLRSLVPWPDRGIPAALIASILDMMDDCLQVAEPLFFAVAQERMGIDEAASELEHQGWSDSEMPLAPWQYPHTP